MRVEHWERILVQRVAESSTAPFVWGSHDCVTFAAGLVQAITGRDVLEGLPAWADPRSARRAIESAGGLAQALTDRFGEPIAPAMAQRGDLATLKASATPDGIEATGWTVAVCVGEYFLAPGVGGLCRVPLDSVEQAWRVD